MNVPEIYVSGQENSTGVTEETSNMDVSENSVSGQGNSEGVTEDTQNMNVSETNVSGQGISTGVAEETSNMKKRKKRSEKNVSAQKNSTIVTEATSNTEVSETKVSDTAPNATEPPSNDTSSPSDTTETITNPPTPITVIPFGNSQNELFLYNYKFGLENTRLLLIKSINIRIYYLIENTERGNLDNNSGNPKLRKPHLIILGGTGTGKSSLAKVLLGEKLDSQDSNFPVCSGIDSCTKETTYAVGNWVGKGPFFTIVDTPGNNFLQQILILIFSMPLCKL